MFTLEDAENSGELKREVKGEVAKVAKREYPRLWEHFENVCLDVDREPEKVLVDLLVRAIDNDDVADRILNTDVNMGKLQAGEYRKDDMREVIEMANEFNLFENEKSTVDKIIERRLESVAGGPFDNIKQESDQGGRKVKQLERRIETLQQELEKTRQSTETTDEVEEEENVVEVTGSNDLDDIFGEEEEESVPEESEEEDEDSGVDVVVDMDDLEPEEPKEDEEDG